MLKSTIVALVVLLAGCVSQPSLPTTDTIVKIKTSDSSIVANSDKYSYRFFRTGLRTEFQRYKTFYESFQQQILGVRVNFNVTNHEVVAEYTAIVDGRRLDDTQRTQLTSVYKGTKMDQGYFGILFKTDGFWTEISPQELDDSYKLKSPIVVSINDKTKVMSPYAGVLLLPVFPLVMMYGCATGPCV